MGRCKDVRTIWASRARIAPRGGECVLRGRRGRSGGELGERLARCRSELRHGHLRHPVGSGGPIVARRRAEVGGRWTEIGWRVGRAVSRRGDRFQRCGGACRGRRCGRSGAVAGAAGLAAVGWSCGSGGNSGIRSGLGPRRGSPRRGLGVASCAARADDPSPLRTRGADRGIRRHGSGREDRGRRVLRRDLNSPRCAPESWRSVGSDPPAWDHRVDPGSSAWRAPARCRDCRPGRVGRASMRQPSTRVAPGPSAPREPRLPQAGPGCRGASCRRLRLRLRSRPSLATETLRTDWDWRNCADPAVVIPGRWCRASGDRGRGRRLGWTLSQAGAAGRCPRTGPARSRGLAAPSRVRAGSRSAA